MDSHHAWLIRASSLETADIPQAYKLRSADIEHMQRQRLSIDDARELSLLASSTPFEASHRIFVIVTQDIAVEAQNALLKLFEDPPAHARFYIVVPETAMLLPTLLSRLSSSKASDKASAVENGDFKIFTEASIAERLETIAQKTKEKDSVWVDAILQGCEAAASSSRNETFLADILLARQYIKTRGASAKMLLEHLALGLSVH